MIYRFIICPNCFEKKPQHTYVRGEFIDYIGLQYERCPYCGKIYQTNKKLYSQMTKKEKNKMEKIFIKDFIQNTFMLSMILVAIILGILSFLFHIDFSKKTIVIVFLVSFVLSSLRCYYASWQNFEKIKQMTINDFHISDFELKKILTGDYILDNLKMQNTNNRFL